MLQKIGLMAFGMVYVVVCIKLLLQKKIRFFEGMRKYHIFLLLFIFVLITNYNTWYCLWLFPSLLYAKGNRIKFTLNLATGSQIAMQIAFLYLGEYQIVGFVFLFILVGIVLVLPIMEYVKKRMKQEKMGGEK